MHHYVDVSPPPATLQELQTRTERHILRNMWQMDRCQFDVARASRGIHAAVYE